MPTILVMFDLRVVIYPNDHRPSHVHVIGRGLEAVFSLHCPDGPVELRENYGFSRKELAKVVLALNEQLETLCDVWRHIHGNF